MENTKKIPNRNGKNLFTVSIGDKDLKKYKSYTKEEGEKFTLPDLGNSYYIETSTMKKYYPKDTIKVVYSMHFEIIK